jgi:hypothetical protein
MNALTQLWAGLGGLLPVMVSGFLAGVAVAIVTDRIRHRRIVASTSTSTSTEHRHAGANGRRGAVAVVALSLALAVGLLPHGAAPLHNDANSSTHGVVSLP